MLGRATKKIFAWSSFLHISDKIGETGESISRLWERGGI